MIKSFGDILREGNLNEDVVVVDTFENGETITFVWNRGKSNENINDTGQGKSGISFYEARYVYRDPYLQRDTVKTSNLRGLSVVGTVLKDDKEVTLVIQERKEGKDEKGNRIIRIFSATYANDKIRADYFHRVVNMMRRDGNEHPRLRVSPENEAFIESTTKEQRRIMNLERYLENT
ncbi:MAG: hypothetical protein FWB99_09250 [Treponema sp.]|nr:hypothetical protein [Treponema sp.]